MADSGMKPEVKYGLSAGIGVCLWISVEYWLGFHSARLAVGEFSSGVSLLILAVAVSLLLREKRAAAATGRLGLVPGVAAGLRSSFLAALIVYCFLSIHDQYLNPGWMDAALDWKVAQLRAVGVAETEIRKEIIFFRRAHSPVGLVATTVVGMTVLGAIYSFGLTLLLRRKAPPAAARKDYQ